MPTPPPSPAGPPGSAPTPPPSPLVALPVVHPIPQTPALSHNSTMLGRMAALRKGAASHRRAIRQRGAVARTCHGAGLDGHAPPGPPPPHRRRSASLKDAFLRSARIAVVPALAVAS